MRIGVDYTAAVRQGGGIGRYARSLFRAVAELDCENEYVLWVAGRPSAGDREDWPDNFRMRMVPVSDRWVNLLWQRLGLPVPIEALVGRLAAFHSPDFVLPPTLDGTRTVLTVHDLSFLRVPECFQAGFREYLTKAVRRAVARADLILADSESTRLDVIELLSVAEDRVVALYPGVQSRFQPVKEAESLQRCREKYGLGERFVLGLGTLQPRKNFTGLIDAFSLLKVPDVQLVIAGGAGWLEDPIYEAAARPHLEGRVRLLGFVDDEDLPALYSLASVFAFPSLYEGFGLPVLEAMGCGTPVVTARNSSLPEVAGDAALLVDARSAEELAAAMRLVLTDDGMRERLVVRGKQQASTFTWNRAARELVRRYEELV